MTGHEITAYEPDSMITAVRRAAAVRPAAPPWTTIAPLLDLRALGVTRSGVIWAGSWGGVISYDPAGAAHLRYGSEHGLPGNTVVTLCVDHADRVWTAHAPSGVACFDQDRWRVHRDLRDEPVLALAPAREGGVWAVSERGLYRLESIDDSVAVAPGTMAPRALLEVGEGVFVGGLGGVFRDGDRLAEGSCVGLACGRDDAVWAATADEVFPLGGGAAHASPGTTGLVSGNGAVYAVTVAGISRLADYAVAPCSDVTAVAADGRSLWVAHKRSLSRLWWSDTSSPTWEEDVLSNEPADALSEVGRCAVADGDEVLAGTARGLVRLGAGGFTHDAAAGDVRALVRSAAETWLLAWPHGIGRVRGVVDFRGPQPPGLPVALAAPLHALTTAGLFRHEQNRWVPIAGPLPAAARCIARTPDGTWWGGTSGGIYRVDRASAWQLAGEHPGPLTAKVRCLAVLGERLWAATDRGLWVFDDGWQERRIAGVDPTAITAMAPAAADGQAWFADAQGVRHCSVQTLVVTEAALRWDAGIPGTPVAIVDSGGAALTIVGAGGIGWRR